MKKLTLTVNAEISQVGAILDFFEDSLKKLKINSRYYNESMLIFEESIVRLIGNADPGSKIDISVYKRWNIANVEASVPGTAIESFTDQAAGLGFVDESNTSEVAIRDTLLQAFEEKLQYSRKGKYNCIKVTVGSKDTVFLKAVICAIAAGLLLGIILRTAMPTEISAIFNEKVLKGFVNIYIGILTPLTTPALFLSVVCSIAKIRSFYDSGKICIKSFQSYAMTTIFSVVSAILIFLAIMPGEIGVMKSTAGANTGAATATGTTGENFIEDSWSIILGQFQDMNTLAVLAIAVVLGIALSMVGKYSSMLRDIINAMAALLNKALELLLAILPAAAFLSTMAIVIDSTDAYMLSVLEMIGVLILGMLAILLMYAVVLAISGRTRPIPFFSKLFKNIKGGFLYDSKFNLMNRTMRCCKRNFGIKPELYNFTIPFGSSFNMDGLTSYLTIAGLFLLRMTGNSLPLGRILPLAIMVIVFSLAASLTPASEVTCLVALCGWMNIPAASLGMLLGLAGVIGIVLKVMNTCGDMVVTYSIARKEKLLDEYDN